MRFALSYSGGKDSALSLYKLVQQGHTPVALITTINSEQQRSWFHGIPQQLLQDVADSMQIPLIVCDSTPKDYTESLEAALGKAKKLGAEACAFGDIDIDDHKTWNDQRCANQGLECLLPLWKMDREAAIQEMLDAGFKALIKIVDSSILDESFLGETLTASLVQDIKAAGADACGENGEYHTFVYDGPLFSKPVAFKRGEIIDLGTHKAVDIFE